jgi:hypothetical protein
MFLLPCEKNLLLQTYLLSIFSLLSLRINEKGTHARTYLNFNLYSDFKTHELLSLKLKSKVCIIELMVKSFC